MKTLPLFATALLLAGCATAPTTQNLQNLPMSTVMRICDEHMKNFKDYSQCIRVNFDKYGNDPDASSVRAFYALIAEIEEANQKGGMTNIQAKAAAHRAYMSTVGAEINRNAANNRETACMVIGNMLVCK